MSQLFGTRFSKKLDIKRGEKMTNWNNISFAQKGWECPRCGRINAPWLPCCSCSKSTYYVSWTKDMTTTGGTLGDLREKDEK